ncbi:hypothetical protein LRY29_01800 [Candidatus Saccharibacteria bacterium]|nr:hypothetical protein [Candidatus Saccharibacteria bacterium]
MIEVLFAITVFSLVVVSALALMNQGTAASQRALEVTLVRQQIDNQAETLRFLHESYVAAYGNANSISSSTGPARQFYDIIQRVNATGATSVSELASGAQSCPALPGGSFVTNQPASDAGYKCIPVLTSRYLCPGYLRCGGCAAF